MNAPVVAISGFVGGWVRHKRSCAKCVNSSQMLGESMSISVAIASHKIDLLEAGRRNLCWRIFFDQLTVCIPINSGAVSYCWDDTADRLMSVQCRALKCGRWMGCAMK